MSVRPKRGVESHGLAHPPELGKNCQRNVATADALGRRFWRADVIAEEDHVLLGRKDEHVEHLDAGLVTVRGKDLWVHLHASAVKGGHIAGSVGRKQANVKT